MGCIFCSLGTAISVVLDALERISTWTVCAILTCCLAITLIIVLMTGIGIGYHYCYIHYVASGPRWNKTSQEHYLTHVFNNFLRENIHLITKRELKENGSTSLKFDNKTYLMERTPVIDVSKFYLAM